MLAAMPKAKGGQPYQATGTRAVPVETSAPTLASLGVTKNQSSRWQKLARMTRDHYELGRVCHEAWELCGRSKPRFGQWLSTNFVECHNNTLHNARRLFEVFGQRREEVAGIPVSGLYLLAQPQADSARESVLGELGTGGVSQRCFPYYFRTRSTAVR